IDVGDGTWTDELTAAYAERVLAKLEPHVENWPDARGSGYVLNPDELERRHLRRLLRAGPGVSLAPHAPLRLPRDAREEPLHGRRGHVPGPWTQRCIRPHRGKQTAENPQAMDPLSRLTTCDL